MKPKFNWNLKLHLFQSNKIVFTIDGHNICNKWYYYHPFLHVYHDFAELVWPKTLIAIFVTLWCLITILSLVKLLAYLFNFVYTGNQN